MRSHFLYLTVSIPETHVPVSATSGEPAVGHGLGCRRLVGLREARHSYWRSWLRAGETRGAWRRLCEKRRTRAFTPWEVKERNVLEGSGRTGKQRTTEPWGALDLAHPLALLCPNPQSPGQSAVAVLLAVRSGQQPPNHLGLWEDLCSKVDPPLQGVWVTWRVFSANTKCLGVLVKAQVLRSENTGERKPFSKPHGSCGVRC